MRLIQHFKTEFYSFFIQFQYQYQSILGSTGYAFDIYCAACSLQYNENLCDTVW